MKQITIPHVVAAVIIASLLCAAIKAQEQPQPTPETVEQKTGAPKTDAQGVPKVEIGVHYSRIGFFGYSQQSHAVGGRVTYNFTDHLAVEGEANFFPVQIFGDGYVTGGRPFQAQFGVKAGKRFRRFGLFVKARPGLVTFDETRGLIPGERLITFDGREYISSYAITEKKKHFSFDLGVVAEVYASRRVFARLDAGDTMIRYGTHNEDNFSDFYLNLPSFNTILKVPSQTRHTFQLNMGVGFHLGTLGGDADATAPAVPRQPKPSAATRFEAGAHFTSLTLSPISFRQLFTFPIVVFSLVQQTQTAPGFGGRFTYNLTNYLAVEAETNLLPRQTNVAVGASGRITQGQFGLKAGHRFERFGLFGKVRPGFVSFGHSLTQTGTTPFTFGEIHSLMGVFEFGRRTYFSTDVGGVFEVYPARRWLLRFDGGDTIIRYSPRSLPNFFSLRNPIIVAPPETSHNFQFTTGVGFRF
ncbi:MAG TPA: outer membrane beta-barrel protein [Pyrinomonadaceae bacterium]|nr:outer membrane beta-barrel protein [Pyrinomonadaceae bacterium]